MPTATASSRASAFSHNVRFVAEPWSGRVDPSECNRPGGLLVAALMRCAGERGLSFNELASTMGVSYWSLSQLRIGFRPIEALDDELADACALFLDRPPLTIQMLAGLLDPGEALASAALTAQDIVHARQLLVSNPDDLELAVPPNPARPLQTLAVDELAELQREHGANPAVCGALRAELRHRPMSKTELLRAVLQPSADAPPAPEALTPGPVVLRCAQCQTRLRVPHLDGPGEIRCPSCQTEYAVHWQEAICLVQRLEVPATDEAADEPDGAPAPGSAWDVLGLAAHSPWDEVERARRSLLQQYHPDRLGHVSPLVHKLAEEAFKRVGDAYETLKAQR